MTLASDLTRDGTERIETHISWVFLAPETVWKVKKPVDLGFLDFTTADKRRLACEAEVRLNRRLAPDVYRGVVPVTRGSNGHHRVGGSGTIVDWAVEMRRLPDDRRADNLLHHGKLSTADVDGLAERIACFHAEMPTDATIAEFGHPQVLLRNVRENFSQTRDSVRKHLTDAEAREIEDAQVGFVEAHHDLLATRMRSGRIRDGHGDLRLEHVYLTENGPTIIDCIEFNERFRYADVCADIAFLSMDLERFGRVDFAERFVASYARASGDYDLYSLVNFYEGYRAYVRAKIASMLAADTGAAAPLRARAERDARRCFVLALATGRPRLLRPSLVAVGGMIASGKSTIAEAIGDMMAAPVVDTDRTRKSLLGVRARESVRAPPWEGAYAPETTDSVYSEVFRRAGLVLESGRPVVIDASFRSMDRRAAATALAARHGVPFLFVETRAPDALCLRRLRERGEGPSVSDAGPELYDEFRARWETVDEIAPAQHVVIDTARPLEHAVDQLRKHLPAWPAGMTQ